MNARIALLIVVVFLAFSTLACGGPNPAENTSDENGEVADFWDGVFDGATSFAAYLASLFNDDIQPYDVHNNGANYNHGFWLFSSVFMWLISQLISGIFKVLFD